MDLEVKLLCFSYLSILIYILHNINMLFDEGYFVFTYKCVSYKENM